MDDYRPIESGSLNGTASPGILGGEGVYYEKMIALRGEERCVCSIPCEPLSGRVVGLMRAFFKKEGFRCRVGRL